MATRKIVKAHKGDAGEEKSPRKPGYSRLHIDIPEPLRIRLGALAAFKRTTMAALATEYISSGCARQGFDKHVRAGLADSQLESEPVE